MATDPHGAIVFVTGTDTGVGKTIVTASMARHFHREGLKVGVMKPIETGVQQVSEPGPDAQLLTWAAQSADPIDWVSPYRFELPASPLQSAARAGETIDPAVIFKALSKLRKNKDIVFVEGAGGLMVPIRGGYLTCDMVSHLALPMLIVTRPDLGTLNHTLLTTFAARTMGIELSGFLINKMPDTPSEVQKEAPHLLSSIASADLLAVLPEVNGSDQEIIVHLSDTLKTLPTYHWLLASLGLPV